MARWTIIFDWPSFEELSEMYVVWSRSQNPERILKIDTFIAGVHAEVREKDRGTWLTQPLRAEGRNDLADKVDAIRCKHIPYGLGWIYRLRYHNG